jgi:hypothetical protein
MPITDEPTAEEATNADPLDGSTTRPGPHVPAGAGRPDPDPQSPPAGGAQHPRALEILAEVALWYGRPLYAALGAAAEDSLCVSPRWHATVDSLTRTPLVTIDLVVGQPRPPRGGDGLGDFTEVRQLRLWESRL